VTIIPPGVPHIYRAARQDPWSIFWIHFAGPQTEPFLESLGVSTRRPRLHVPDTRMMCDAFEDVFACLNYHYSDAGLMAMTGELICLLSKIMLHHGASQRAQQVREDRVMSTVRFMQDHIDMPVSLEDLAAHCRSGVASLPDPACSTSVSAARCFHQTLSSGRSAPQPVA
jgi:hypothetical protein